MTIEDVPKPKRAKRPPSVGQLRVDAAIFQRLCRTVLHAVSSDTDRAHHNSLHLVASDDRLIVEGTDGVCLAVWEHEGSFSVFDILIPKDRVSAFLRALPKTSNQTELFEDGFVRISHGRLVGSGVTIEFAVPDVDFPDLSEIIAKRMRRALSAPPFSLHPIYLKRAGDLFMAATADGCAPIIDGGPTGVEAVRMTSPDAPGLLFLVMPYRMEDDDPEPQERPVQGALTPKGVTAVSVSVGGRSSLSEPTSWLRPSSLARTACLPWAWCPRSASNSHGGMRSYASASAWRTG
jgi:hypothetical protein